MGSARSAARRATRPLWELLDLSRSAERDGTPWSVDDGPSAAAHQQLPRTRCYIFLLAVVEPFGVPVESPCGGRYTA